MKAKSLRSILGFYSAEGDPEAAFQAVRGATRGRVFFFTPDQPVEPGRRRIERYSALRLEGEFLIAAEAEPSDVEAVVKQLQSTGSPAVFVLREDLDSAPSPDAGAIDSKLILSRLRDNQVALDLSRRDLTEAARVGHALTAAAEWLLDNAYLVRTQIAEIRRHLPRNFSKILPGLAPVYELAEKLVANTEHALTETNITDWLRENQTTKPLTMAELWFFPLLLRMALIEALRQLAFRVSRAQQLRETAYLWANRLAAAARLGPEEFDRMLGRMETEPVAVQPRFVISLVEQLQDEEIALAPVQRWIERRVNTPITELVRSEHTREASERVSTANAFGSLRALSQIDFTKIFEAVSLIEAELRQDPAYASSDFTTRDQCRTVVDRIARQSGVDEFEVARRAVRLASEAQDPQTRHAAYYLLADGVARLEADTHARVPLRTRVIRGLRRQATGVYLTSITALALCFLALAVGLAWDGGVRSPALLILLGALALFPLGELSIQIVNALVISLLPPEPLPKMDFKEGIPPENATLVVVPMMLSSRKVVEQRNGKAGSPLSRQPGIESFLQPVLRFHGRLRSGDRQGDQRTAWRRARGHLHSERALPGRAFPAVSPPACVVGKRGNVDRARAKARQDRRSERLSCRGEGSDEILIEGRLPLPVRYVITLDADTQLPPGTARRMVETISHPLNRVEIDPETRVRKRGFTIIQPRVSIALPGATATRFTRVFADTTGTDPYCQTVSDAQQDLFGEAIFHGKAIYDVQAFRTVLGDRFPAETLLSHDLIEGAHAGVGLASDIELFENLPLDYVSFSQRQHRWIRGDWQIAPWIFPRVPAPGGTEPNPLSIMNRWRILDNLRRSLVPVASLLLLLFGWLISAAPGVWSLVVGLAVAIPALAPLLDRLARQRARVRCTDGAARPTNWCGPPS